MAAKRALSRSDGGARVVPFAVAFALAIFASATLSAADGRSGAIRAFAERWLGTPYLWGGDAHTGIDCSAYLRQMYRALFGVELPRTTKQQIDLGIDLPVSREKPERNWAPGDLIFFIDRAGVPSHVVVYMGHSQLTHSVSGRGVVIDGMKQLWGRRIVARRLLVPRPDDRGGYGPVPAAGPIIPHEVPCPPEVVARPLEVRRFKTRRIEDVTELGDRDICDYRALASALEHTGSIGKDNADKLRAHAEWLERIDALKGEFGP